MRRKNVAALVTCFFLSFLVMFVFPSVARAEGDGSIGAQAWGGVCVGSGTNDGDVATIQGAQCLIANILSVVISLIGLAGFVMLIIGAFQFLMSGDNSKGVEEGRNTITHAIIGLVLALSAWFILNIISNFTGVPSILHFQLSVPSSTSSLYRSNTI